jgi:hypothetical protein
VAESVSEMPTRFGQLPQPTENVSAREILLGVTKRRTRAHRPSIMFDYCILNTRSPDRESPFSGKVLKAFGAAAAEISNQRNAALSGARAAKYAAGTIGADQEPRGEIPHVAK